MTVSVCETALPGSSPIVHQLEEVGGEVSLRKSSGDFFPSAAQICPSQAVCPAGDGEAASSQGRAAVLVCQLLLQQRQKHDGLWSAHARRQLQLLSYLC